MKIGILETDPLTKELTDVLGSYPERFKTCFLKVDPDLTFKTYHCTELNFPEDTNECDAYLITGSRHGTYDDLDWITELKKLIVKISDNKKKLIGVCFGHQIIAEALGGHSGKSELGWNIGVIDYKVETNLDWMTPSREEFAIIASHQDQVTKLPKGAKLIASTKTCPIASFSIENHIFTLQSHPEYTKEFSRYLMEKRRGRFTPELYQQGVKSLECDLDDKLIFQWLVNFLRS